MNNFIFYTPEGFSKSPTGKDVENFQILGFEMADSKEEAFSNLINNNKWISENGFSADEIICKEIVN